MGKIRVRTIGDEEQEKKQLEEAEKKRQAKIAEKKASGQKKNEQKIKEEEQAEPKTEESAKASEQEEKVEEEKIEEPKEKKEVKKAPKDDQTNFRSKAYSDLSTKIDPLKTYSLSEGLDLLSKLQRGKFDETVELHINTTSAGVSGSITLPFGSGKQTRVAIASDELIGQVEKGKLDFDILIATPDMMPKLAKVARILGPKGLMPNPKNGTITTNPAETAKKYEGGQVNFKTEAKNPLLHLTVGKMSFGADKLSKNIEAMIVAVKKANIINVTLKSTMSPGIKIRI